jgi:alanyl-tRNA synthetase
MRQDWRVEFVCGGRAEEAARQDFLRLRAAAEKLSCAPEELVAAAARALSERDANFKRTRGLLERLAEVEAAEFVRKSAPRPNGVRVIVREFQDIEPEFLGYFATHVAKTDKAMVLLAEQGAGHILFAQHPAAGSDMNGLLKDVLAKFGGQGGGTRDFARGRLEGAAQTSQALGLAQDLLFGEQAAV